MVCITSLIQAPIQSFLRPAMWLPGCNRLHSHTETWRSDSVGADSLLEDIVNSVPDLMESDITGATYVVNKVDEERGFVRIFAFTWANWLDVMEFTMRGNKIQARSFSSGFLPLSVPFAVIFNCVLFWMPFYDIKYNRARLDALREVMSADVISQDK
ncbi:uncharacterized protein LOC110461690 [Mizuhopecten yessoensis]|uniref:Uncharacterized protein n=1 Tax=Mizuhopecten yessoensis TaxID=6573 RepID=A0A210R2M1_MIZYE|nr:uncharacterized protein LOC110461690 [Mizuhopecten yessoensis]OWF55288.1 hypothetical protein KP79_PYT16342 [Mizuhopecten yessoensis]